MESVQVAVRVRPLVPQEINSGCRSCIEVVPESNQIITKLKKDQFTFNYVFDSDTPQVDVYSSAIQNLVQQLFKGYNVTVLAYGQTGSGKTFSMGTCPSSNENDVGIIPRAINDIFNVINNDQDWSFTVTVSFLELYNEQLIDLLSQKSSQAVVDLRESTQGILIPGLTQRVAHTADDVMQCLTLGSLSRTTGATAMNAQSSRSHAIFTIYIHQVKRSNPDEAMSAKFHLVDLAGSERSKKTKAEGKRFHEGVNINKELFVLGNVISALCDGAAFVNYRDSKLTRMLQDSLGGNSLTLMLACISPADSNLEETVNTLRYADRARKIKNKPIVNQDPTKQEINRLKQKIEDLQLALLSNQGENSCPPEHREMVEVNRTLLEKNRLLSASLDSALTQTTVFLQRTLMAETAREKMREILKSVDFTNILDTVNSPLSDMQKTSLMNIKALLDEFKSELHNSEIDRVIYEDQLCADASVHSTHIESFNNPAEEDASREEYVLQQAKLSQEIQEISKNLAWKEALAAKLIESHSVEASMKESKVEDTTQLKAQIDSLLSEKEELEKQLKNNRNPSIDHKLAEQRRKRVKELEEKISLLNRKVVDQDRIIRMKERNEEKMKTLNTEIMTMKQMKVRLINQMKTEGDKYRQWRAMREQEVCKLRQQNQQKETKFVKMETYYQKQQNVYKRKLEESTSVIKRLKETLALQKSTKEKRMLLGNAEKVNQWVSQEFSTMINTLEAEQMLDNLIEDRTLLAKELGNLKKSLSDPTIEEEEKNNVKKQIRAMNEDLELRSTQIVDLKQKLQSLDSYQDKSKTKWDCIQTMDHAKTALKYTFETANIHITELFKEKTKEKVALQDLKESYASVVSQLQEKERLLKEEAEKYMKAETDHNDRVFVLLKRLQEHDREKQFSDSAAGPSIDIDKEDFNNEKKMVELQNRIQELEKQLERNKPKKSKAPKIDKWNAVITPETRKKFFEEDDDDDDDLGNLDDSGSDPDWRGTPIYRRLKNIKAATTRGVAMKRKSDDEPTCRCDEDVCTNKENLPSGSLDLNQTSSSASDGDCSFTFKRPRLL